jgi:hypothetical protein
MKKNFKKMKAQFDYQELIDELKGEIRAGTLTEGDSIQVLRTNKAHKNGYSPIIDWHYSKETMKMELAPDSTDDQDDIEEKKIIKDQYLVDLPDLKDMTVKACLEEMLEKSK